MVTKYIYVYTHPYEHVTHNSLIFMSILKKMTYLEIGEIIIDISLLIGTSLTKKKNILITHS